MRPGREATMFWLALPVLVGSAGARSHRRRSGRYACLGNLRVAFQQIGH
jgi:hypothetical protein